MTTMNDVLFNASPSSEPPFVVYVNDEHGLRMVKIYPFDDPSTILGIAWTEHFIYVTKRGYIGIVLRGDVAASLDLVKSLQLLAALVRAITISQWIHRSL